MIFISVPFSDPDPEIKKQRLEVTAKICAILMNKGFVVSCPLLQGIAIIEKSGMHLPDDYGYWKSLCDDFVRACSEVWVIDLEGYNKSSGVKGEVMAAHEAGIPVQLVTIDLDDGMIAEHGYIVQDDRGVIFWPQVDLNVAWKTR